MVVFCTLQSGGLRRLFFRTNTLCPPKVDSSSTPVWLFLFYVIDKGAATI